METIIKSKLTHNFTIVSNNVLRSKDLSARAKGLHCYLISLPGRWVINKRELHKHFKEGRRAIELAFNELIVLGLVFDMGQQNKKGKFLHKQWVVYQDFQNKLQSIDIQPLTNNRSTITVDQKTVDQLPLTKNVPLVSKEVNKETKLSLEVLECFEKIKPLFKESDVNRDRWSVVIDELNRIDNLSFEEIESVCRAAKAHDFWGKQFLSVVKLRRKNKDGVKYYRVFQEQCTKINNEYFKFND